MPAAYADGTRTLLATPAPRRESAGVCVRARVSAVWGSEGALLRFACAREEEAHPLRSPAARTPPSWRPTRSGPTR
jgi:hypothetical protein